MSFANDISHEDVIPIDHSPVLGFLLSKPNPKVSMNSLDFPGFQLEVMIARFHGRPVESHGNHRTIRTLAVIPSWRSLEGNISSRDILLPRSTSARSDIRSPVRECISNLSEPVCIVQRLSRM